MMPRRAQIMDQLSLVRGIRSVENDHFLSEVYTGLPRSAGKRPAFGSVVSRLTGGSSLLPPYVSLDEATTDQFEFEKPHYAGAIHAPFRPFGPSVEDMTPIKSLQRLQDRRKLLPPLDPLRRNVDRHDVYAGPDQ